MVKKNLVYVNSDELDEMDILTTDLDRPAHELRIEVSRPNPADIVISMYCGTTLTLKIITFNIQCSAKPSTVCLAIVLCT